MSPLPPILFEDDSLIAYDKPSGLLVGPDRWDPDARNLMEMVHRLVSKDYFNIHRLDKPASGVLLCGKGQAMVRALCRLFETGAVSKEYLALVTGNPEKSEDTINLALAPDPGLPGRMRVVKGEGRRSRTSYEVAEKWRGYSLLRVQPLTGRTHQIRVHLSAIGHPILEDRLYRGGSLKLSELKPHYRFKADQEEQPLIRRLALHSHRLSLVHPVTAQPLTIESPMPKDFQICLRYLGRWA